MTDPAYQKLAAYGTVLLLLYALSKTGAGYKTIYYALWLILLVLLVTNAPSLTKLLSPITGGNP